MFKLLFWAALIAACIIWTHYRDDLARWARRRWWHWRNDERR